MAQIQRTHHYRLTSGTFSPSEPYIGVAVHGVLEIIFLAITLPFRLLAAPFRI